MKKFLGQDPIEWALIIGMIYLLTQKNSEFWSQEININDYLNK